jgi:hypothetical protein
VKRRELDARGGRSFDEEALAIPFDARDELACAALVEEQPLGLCGIQIDDVGAIRGRRDHRPGPIERPPASNELDAPEVEVRSRHETICIENRDEGIGRDGVDAPRIGVVGTWLELAQNVLEDMTSERRLRRVVRIGPQGPRAPDLLLEERSFLRSQHDASIRRTSNRLGREPLEGANPELLGERRRKRRGQASIDPARQGSEAESTIQHRIRQEQ